MSDKNDVQKAPEGSEVRDAAETSIRLVKPGQAQSEQQEEKSPSDGTPDEQEPLSQKSNG